MKRPWLLDEVATLRRVWLANLHRQPKQRALLLAPTLGRSYYSVRDKAIYLGLPAGSVPGRTRDCTNLRPWAEEEKDTLRRVWLENLHLQPGERARLLCKSAGRHPGPSLDRTWVAIYGMAVNLKLPHSRIKENA